jgi:glycosyltransferase involved in cell wall biosynthesis
MIPRVVLLRGTAANPWELRPWEVLHQSRRVQVELVVPPDNQYELGDLTLPTVRVRTTGALMPPGPAGRGLLKLAGQRHLGLESALKGSDVVHAAELGYWFSAQAARLKPRLNFRLALTVWETIPFTDAYRNIRTRRYRREVLEATDLYLPVTERARAALALEGVDDGSMTLCPPGVDIARFDARPSRPGSPPLILSIGRLVWEKGHQDLLRALAVLRKAGHADARAAIVGLGPERKRLERVARDLGVANAVEFRGSIPHAEMPAVFAEATCLVLASVPMPYWEEQFGMVLAEAMAAGLPVVAAASGAIPEVLNGYGTLFGPGDWRGLADVLAEGTLAAPPGSREEAPRALLERYSAEAAADRLAAAYARLVHA